jgi:hypothetical protein
MNTRSIDQYSAAIWSQRTQSNNDLVSGQKQQVLGAALTYCSRPVGMTVINVYFY